MYQGKELSLSNYLPISGDRTTEFILFQNVLVLCEMQTASSRIWTQYAVSISCYNNHYTVSTCQSASLSLF